MPRVTRRPSPPAAPVRPTPPAAPSRSTGRSATASTAADSFTASVDPQPKTALNYRASFASHFEWSGVEYGPQTGNNGITLPNIAEAGKPLFIDYGRSLENIGLQGTLKKVEMFYRIDGGPVQSATLAEGESARAPGLRSAHRIDVPAGAKGEVEYWFKLTGEDGKTHWDSKFGQNYRTNIVPQGGSIVRFDDLWGESLSQPLVAGSTLRLAYDVDRIKPFLRGTSHHGAATWGVVAYVSFDGKPAQEIPLTAVKRGQYGVHEAIEPVEAAVEIPTDAKNVSIWIKGHGYANSVFDSDFGKNYSFPISPAQN